jgi:hypothetical protein
MPEELLSLNESCNQFKLMLDHPHLGHVWLSLIEKIVFKDIEFNRPSHHPDLTKSLFNLSNRIEKLSLSELKMSLKGGGGDLIYPP